MRAVFYFTMESAGDQNGAFRYQAIQSVLKGYVTNVTQRTYSLITELTLPEGSVFSRRVLILPIGNWRRFSRSAYKVFRETKRMRSIYFKSLPAGEAEKLHCYLTQTKGYLGASELTSISDQIIEFDRIVPSFRIRNKRISILTDVPNNSPHFRLDLLLAEIIESLPFDSWQYETFKGVRFRNFWSNVSRRDERDRGDIISDGTAL